MKKSNIKLETTAKWNKDNTTQLLIRINNRDIEYLDFFKNLEGSNTYNFKKLIDFYKKTCTHF